MNLALLSILMFVARPTVELRHDAGRWGLLVDGKPFIIHGAGGDASKPLLAADGGNSYRTWGADNLDKQLDEAQQLGLKVTVGIWLGHKEHGFRYDDPEQVMKQLKDVRAVILKYKDKPAVLMWALGNEMEGYEAGDDPKIWNAIEDLAHMAHQLDPNHPTMSVIAEIGGNRVAAINKLCPSLDIVGINSYGGAPSIYERYVKQGGKKPYILTEFGPPGTWETAKTPWERPFELTSTAKEATYEKAYKANVVDHPDLCLGAYAFTWGNKQEATATWYGMFLPDGSKLGAVDVMQRIWTGKPPEHPCPRILSLTIDGDASVDPGAVVNAHVKAMDPDGDPLKISWSLTADGGTIGLNGDKEDLPDVIKDAVSGSASVDARATLPKTPGSYRLFVVVRNTHGGAAVANLPLHVRGTAPAAMGSRARLPFTLYADAGQPLPFIPSGWMGNTGAMKLDVNSTISPHLGSTCIRWDYTGGDGWGSIAWQSPEGDWGDKPGGYDFSGAKKLVVWARGAVGGEQVSFAMGLIKSDKKYYDTAIIPPVKTSLTTSWQKIEIPLDGKDLRRIKVGLVMTVTTQGQPATVYLDDITVE
jgi:hypothetical protein